MLTRLFPHPGLTVLLIAVWLLMLNGITVGRLVLAIFLGTAIPIFTAPFWPDRPRLRFGWPIVDYLAIVIWDILVANFHVARIILFRRNRDLRSHWLVVPLALRSAEAITMLAGTISLTPGTVSSDVSTDGRFLLVHALDVPDPATEIARIKQRYEARLEKIFR